MKEYSFLKILFLYIKDHVKTIAINVTFLLIYLLVFTLYAVDLEPVGYGLLLSVCVAIILVVIDFTKYLKKHKELCIIEEQITVNLARLPIADTLIEQDYQNILKELYNSKQELISRTDNKQREMMDYYTLWAHQIKTPIAAMRLLFQSDETKESEEKKELMAQVFKIEQYVEMVLGYLKIENAGSDLVLQHYDLSEIIRQGIRKYANIFIRKNIALDFKEMDCKVLTDEKWLQFVIEQILSNALKYTKSGKISIYMEPEIEKTLVIEDTGIGIAEEDLPRVFERGYTGYNGRMDKKATGIGLYLCKKILDKLSHKISITSKLDRGTTVKINLSSREIIIE